MARPRWRTVLVCVVAFALGLFVSLFTAGVALFADGPFAERPPVALVSVAIFAALGVGLGALTPRAWKPIAVTLAVSALPVVLFFGRDIVGQVPMMVLAAGFAIGDAASGAFGAWAGARLRGRRRG